MLLVAQACGDNRIRLQSVALLAAYYGTYYALAVLHSRVALPLAVQRSVVAVGR